VHAVEVDGEEGHAVVGPDQRVPDDRQLADHLGGVVLERGQGGVEELLLPQEAGRVDVVLGSIL
jgi:hypothetical protein